MPFHSKEYAKKYISENREQIRNIRNSYYLKHKETEKIRFAKIYAYKAECKRLRSILYL